MTTTTEYEALRARLAQLVADRDARARQEAAARREASGDAEIEEAEAQLLDPAVLEEHAAAEEAWAMGELAAIGDEDAPLTQKVEKARIAHVEAELHRGRERHRLRHEDRRREVDQRRDAARVLRDQAVTGGVGDGALPAANTVGVRSMDDGTTITTRTLVAEGPR